MRCEPAIARRAFAALMCVLALAGGPARPQSSANEPNEPPPGSPPALNTRDAVTVVLAPRRRAVLSAAVPGRIVVISKELGQEFAEDEVLVRLDDLMYQVGHQLAQARLEAAEKDLAQVEKLVGDQTRQRHAQAVLDAARANLDATQRLFDNGHAALVDLENARRDVKTAETDCELVAATSAKESVQARLDLALARGKRELATDELDSCTMEAPYAGRVARVLAHEHEHVERGTPVIEVVDDAVLRAKFLLPSELFRSVRLGQELTLAVRETGERVRVRVTHIAAVLDPASVTFEVYAELDNADGRLRAGMNGLLSLSEFGRAGK